MPHLAVCVHGTQNLHICIQSLTLLSAEPPLAALPLLTADPKLAPDIWPALRFSPATLPCICHLKPHVSDRTVAGIHSVLSVQETTQLLQPASAIRYRIFWT